MNTNLPAAPPPDLPLPPALPPALTRGHRLPGFEVQDLIEPDGVVDDCRSYRAWDLALQRPVVVTEYLPPALAKRGDGGDVVPATRELAPAYAAGLDHFLAQTRCLAQADHPHLLRVLHVLLAQGTAYRVQPAYPGECLQRLRQRMPGPPDEDVLFSLLDEMLSALQVFHDVGAVHGAVHPGRILVLDDDSSLLLAPRTGGGAQLDPYAAPELRAPSPGAAIGAWSDCYALARVARYCITGQAQTLPLDAPTPPLASVVDALSPAHRAMGYAPALLQVLDLAASDDVLQRPQSATEFREWLDQARRTPRPRPTATTHAEAERAVRHVIAALPPRAEAPERIEPPPIDPPIREPAAASETFEAAELAAAAAPTGPASAAARPAKLATPMFALVSVAVVAATAALAWIGWPEAAQPPIAQGAPVPVAQASAAGPSRQAGPMPSAQAVATTPVTDFNAMPPPAAGPAGPDSVASIETPRPAPVAAAIAAPPEVPPAARAAKPAPKPDAKPASRSPNPPSPRSPRERCGERTPFALYRCMQRECATAASRQHPQCVQLRRTDRVD